MLRLLKAIRLSLGAEDSLSLDLLPEIESIADSYLAAIFYTYLVRLDPLKLFYLRNHSYSKNIRSLSWHILISPTSMSLFEASNSPRSLASRQQATSNRYTTVISFVSHF